MFKSYKCTRTQITKLLKLCEQKIIRDIENQNTPYIHGYNYMRLIKALRIRFHKDTLRGPNRKSRSLGRARMIATSHDLCGHRVHVAFSNILFL